MEGIEGESEDSNVGWATGDVDEEEEDDAEMSEDDGFNVDDLLEDDNDDEEDENEDSMDQDVPVPVVVAKKVVPSKKAAAKPVSNIVSVAPTGKKGVSFATTPLGPTGGVSQKAKLFTSNDAEAPG